MGSVVPLGLSSAQPLQRLPLWQVRGPRCEAGSPVRGWWPGGAPCAGPRLSRRGIRASREGRRGGRGSVVSGRPLRLRGSGACSATAGPHGGPLGLRRPRPGRVSFGPWLVVVAACSAPLRAGGPLPRRPAPLGGPLLYSRSVRAGSCGPPGGPRARFRGCPPVWALSPGGPSPARFFVRARVPPRLFRALRRGDFPPPLFAVRWWLSPLAPQWARSRRACRPLARADAFVRVRSDRGAYPTRKARRGTRRASGPGRGVEDPPGGGKTAQGNACRPPSACTVRYQLALLEPQGPATDRTVPPVCAYRISAEGAQRPIRNHDHTRPPIQSVLLDIYS